jgi:alpha-ketoglutarate-dependent taurine dioxygenase
MKIPRDVTISILDPRHNLPLTIEPLSQDKEESSEVLMAWYAANRDFVEKQLLIHGAVLFRRFGVKSAGAFARFVRSVSNNLLSYVDGNSPRTKLAAGIYTSTEYPPEFFISLHNELSYSHQWPDKLIFCCIIAPKQGGETPIADSRTILKRLDHDIVEEFARKQVKYVRNLHGGRGLGVSWQETFESTDKEKVEGFCREANIDFEWKEDGSLRITQIGPGTAIHPRTGEQVWFNQSDQFHPSNNPRYVHQYLSKVYGQDGERLPQNAYFGDGTPIDPSILEHIRETVRDCTACFPWQAGDVLLIDNMLICHGRMPFTGPRKILVAMH